MQWKPVKGFEGYYEVSDEGLVRGLDRTVPDKVYGERFIKGRVMAQADGGYGYKVVNLRRFGGANVRPVHRLVAEAFIPNDEGKITVNHIDGDKTNNRVENLEWATYGENNVHALHAGLRRPRGNPIIQTTIDGEYIATYPSTPAATRATGVSVGSISHCLCGRSNTAGGYRWTRVERCNDYPGDRSTPEDELPAEAQRAETQDIVCTTGNSGEIR